MLALNTPYRPNPDRVFFAFLLAPVAGAFAYAGAFAVLAGILGGQIRVSGLAAIFVFALVVATGCTIVLGIPAYLFFRRRDRLNLLNVAFASGLMGLAPALYLTGSSIWYLAMVHNWDRPISGLVTGMLQHWGLAFASGVAGGLAFWAFTVPRAYHSSHPVTS